MLRLFDFLISLVGVIILFPLFLLISLILKFTGEGEIFYCQKRVGKNGVSFNIFKFATMLKNSSNIGSKTITVKNDPRILPLGKFLRQTKINELPQLYNVLKGDMSLVGPRPLTTREYNFYSKEGKKIISSQVPGLTGIASLVLVNEENLLTEGVPPELFHKKFLSKYKENLEYWFFQNKNITLYFLIILLTLHKIFFKKSDLIWKIFKNLPMPPDKIKNNVKF